MRRAGALGLALMLVAGSAWAQPAPLGPLAEEQVLRRGNGPEPETLDPHKAEGVQASNILRDVYEGLVNETIDGSLEPGAAERWEVSADGRTYTFHLRENARWSNGDAVTAEDFLAGLRRSADPATGSSYSLILAPIENAEAVVAGKLPVEQLGVAVIDPLTLQIRLKGPTAYFLGLLAHSSTYPLHRPSYQQYGDQFAQPGRLVGNGAYTLVERVVQSHVLLERNRHYWNNAATTIDKVYFVATEDVSSELKRFRAGELDWTEQVPANQAKWIRQNLSDVYHVETYLGVYYYGVNVTQPPFKDNPKLRQALSMAIDRGIITSKVMGLGEKAAYSWVPRGVANYHEVQPPWASWTREQRLAEARRLYAEAGYSAERPLQLEIRYNTHDDHKKIATAVAAMWKQWLGVDTRLINEEWKVYLQNRRLKKETQLFRAAWVGDYNDAYSFLEILQSTHGLNDSGWSNPRYDALLAQAAVEGDRARRETLMRQAEQLVMDELPVIPIYFYVSKRLIAPYVVGWQGNIMDHHYTKDMKLLKH